MHLPAAHLMCHLEGWCNLKDSVSVSALGRLYILQWRWIDGSWWKRTHASRGRCTSSISATKVIPSMSSLCKHRGDKGQRWCTVNLVMESHLCTSGYTNSTLSVHMPLSLSTCHSSRYPTPGSAIPIPSGDWLGTHAICHCPGICVTQATLYNMYDQTCCSNSDTQSSSGLFSRTSFKWNECGNNPFSACGI